MNIENLPLFPDSEQIDLKHRDILVNYFNKIQPIVSEFNFAEIFAWRKLRKIFISNYNGEIILSLEKKEKKYFYPPFCDHPEKVILDLLNYYKKINTEIKINAYPDEKLYLIKNIENLLFFEDDRDNYDYLYLTEDLISLPGRKYDGKRNNIKKFYKNYKFEFKELTSNLIPECLSFLEKWCQMKNCRDDLSLTNENEAVNEILKNYEKLPVFGAVIKIDGVIQGFTIGSELNNETGEVIVEKANSEFAGIYQTINQLFCENFLKRYKYVNRQQDTGAPGLRKAKMSYHPFKLIKKYNIGLK